MIVALWVVIILLIVLLVVVSAYTYDRGYEAGRREQRRITNRAVDELRARGVAAQHNIDYLYEQASQRIDRGSGQDRP